jgi:16S rRNA (cytosine967-C5)-methyltransferase
MNPAEIRASAARMLSRIIVRHETSDQVLEGVSHEPLLLELLYGCLRHYFSLSASVNQALHHPLRSKDHDIWCLMIVGVYQRFYTRIPAHAALNETVEGARYLGKPWGKALVNAVLRKAKLASDPERSFEHPEWMARILASAYGEAAPAIMLANNERAPMALRINLSRITPDAYRRLLDTQGVPYRTPGFEPADGESRQAETLILQQPMPAARLPGYGEGLVSIQDAGGQFAAGLLGAGLPPASGARVLDACAAPGGKLFHLIERFPGIDATAVELSPARIEVLRDEARRLQHGNLTTVIGDATGLDWWDGQAFDHVLIDAPCSGSGTIRRHPDIKLLRQSADLPRYRKLQHALLANLWQTLQPGGTLLYCTCSLFPAENDDVISRFLEQTPDAAVCAISLPTGQPMQHGWQLLPTDTDTDAFYYALVRKAAL